MLVFKLTAARSIDRWNSKPAAPATGRIVATVSLVVWISVIFLGRWIGFTSTRAQPAGDSGISIDIESLLPK